MFIIFIGDDADAREKMHNAATMAGLSFGNSQATCAHSIGHSIGALFHKLLLMTKNMYPHPVEFFATNYYAEVDPEMCIGCRECFDRCQMKALILDDEEKSKVDLDRCIGCGLCVAKCPQGAIVLRKKEEEIVPPKDNEELYTRILNRKVEIVKAEEERKEKRRKRREERKAEQNK